MYFIELESQCRGGKRSQAQIAALLRIFEGRTRVVISQMPVPAESGATCQRYDIESMCFGETTLIGNETAISPVVEVRVGCDSALRSRKQTKVA
jgi:hypothetical protein